MISINHNKSNNLMNFTNITNHINNNDIKQNNEFEQIKYQEDDRTNYFNPIIRNSLEYYDSYQPKIQKILNNIEYFKIINGVNVNDEFIFFDSNDKPFFKSRIEQLGMFVPQDNSWKWSWSIPFAKYQNTLISRKILEYAFTLNSSTDLHLKSTLVNSKLIITNQYQIDIYMALSSMLSKKPFIFKYYLCPPEENSDPTIIYYKKNISNPDRKKFISVYVFVVDWNTETI